MASACRVIEIEGQRINALFDTHATYSYVLPGLVRHVPALAVRPPVRVGVGRCPIEVRQYCIVQGKIEGLDFVTGAAVVDDLGWAEGHDLGAVIGRGTMDQWEIRLDPHTGALGLEGLRRRTFTEFRA